ncbi:Metallo-dependent phosphatase-like protein [Hygrophoropsis aurantiaca]|uniref:Metallo-dependent phosphatase-like protein n=1 Tax=Hygrophoropsis aurantiaca TaxID=72124 RepID=A0ACB8AN26_9AGAM|nr:Metallo-dependent phosphatase-like protein [Hygrophoropsis aurantiaca]
MPSSVRLSFIGVILCLTAVLAASGDDGISPSNYTAPGTFPTSVYAQYYNSPTATSAQVQPVISDPVTHEIFPLRLTDPNNIPQNDTTDPHPLPPKASSSKILQQAIAQIQSIAKNPTFGNNTCARCQASLEVAKFVALAAPEEGSELAVQLCELFSYSSTCANTYSRLAIGNILTQVASLADVGGYDGQLLCHEFLSLCPLPPTSPLNLTDWFAKPKPNPLPPSKQPSGKRLKVLHISDFHIDARYATGAEANCTLGQCCRANAFNTKSPDSPLFPAPRFGAYSFDAPYALILSVLQAIPAVAGTEETGFAFTLFTGDMLTHDSENQQSRAFTEYSEVVLYDLFKRLLGPGPVYATLGNHDSYNQDLAAPYAMEGELGKQFDWLYDHVSALWRHQHWLPEASIEMARLHYSAYMVKRVDGLRIISLNTNLWYRSNYFNYINSSHPDTSGILRFLTDELQDAEDAGDRVWIMGHVLSGWDGTNPLLNPTNLFYQIVDRFSPHVIANIFWGHTHEDQMSIFYANNGTEMNAQTAQTLAWIGPSVTPLTNLNSGFRVYEVDSSTFEVLDAHTWQSSVNDFPSLDSQLQYGPTYNYEYNTRKTYGGNITWGDQDPLNATWWHLVTEQMEIDPSLVQTFNTYQGKSSVLTPPCTGDCIPAKICYIRSGSASIAQENCIQGYGSVQ